MLAIATNIPVLLMTAFVLRGHKCQQKLGENLAEKVEDVNMYNMYGKAVHCTCNALAKHVHLHLHICAKSVSG